MVELVCRGKVFSACPLASGFMGFHNSFSCISLGLSFPGCMDVQIAHLRSQQALV